MTVPLAVLGISEYSAAVARTDKAGPAACVLTAFNQEFAAACPGDPTIGLAKGEYALQSFVVARDVTAAPVAPPSDDIGELETALLSARPLEAAVWDPHAESLKALSKRDTAFAISVQFAAAEKEAANAAEHPSDVGAAGDAGSLAETLSHARVDRAARFECGSKPIKVRSGRSSPGG